MPPELPRIVDQVVELQKAFRTAWDNDQVEPIQRTGKQPVEDPTQVQFPHRLHQFISKRRVPRCPLETDRMSPGRCYELHRHCCSEVRDNLSASLLPCQ